MNENLEKDPPTKDCYWGTVYGLFNPNTKEAIVVTQIENPKNTTQISQAILSGLEKRKISTDVDASTWSIKVLNWGICG